MPALHAILFFVLLSHFGALASAQQPKPHLLTPVPIQQVVIDDAFWSPKRKVWREVTIPDCFAKFEKDGALANFDRIRDGTPGEHGGPPWYDGLIYEMIRGCADFLAEERDPALEQRLDGYIERIAAAAAKDPNGYLNTYTQLKEPTHRWGLNGGNDNWQHDIYNAGAMVEAGVHYYRATGKTTLLKVAAKLANHLSDVAGPPPKRNVIPGHSLSEEALVKLHQLFRENPKLKEQFPFPIDENQYLRLAEFFIEARGHHEGRRDFGAYGQDHQPVFEQASIEGHAVRATLMCAGVTALACANNRPVYYRTAHRLWENMIGRKIYVTGGAGATAEGEAFAADYVLPNTGYLESCAAIGSAFFSRNMNLAFSEAPCVDELERVLYNSALCAVSLAGNTYSYVNPLEFERGHTRWSWHGCPCCPPMFLKIMGALPSYIYATDKSGAYVNLFVSSKASLALAGRKVLLHQTTRYPWDGYVRIVVEPERDMNFDLNIRTPGWCRKISPTNQLYLTMEWPGTDAFSVLVNGKAAKSSPAKTGYVRINRKWRRGDIVEFCMEMPIRRVKANPKVAADRDLVALLRGPVVYAVETTGGELRARNVFLPPNAPLTAEYSELLGGVTILKGGFQARYLTAPQGRPADVEAIPYFAYGNRGKGDLRVWLPEQQEKALPETMASGATSSASHCNPSDTVAALNDGIEPKHSADESIPRFTWWDHRGTKEWVQYEFERPTRLSAIEVYWWDERKIARHCRVPQSWRLLFKSGQEWKPVGGASEFGTKPDQFNRVTFDAIETSGLRIEAQLQPDWSGGILEWRVE